MPNGRTRSKTVIDIIERYDSDKATKLRLIFELADSLEEGESGELKDARKSLSSSTDATVRQVLSERIVELETVAEFDLETVAGKCREIGVDTREALYKGLGKITTDKIDREKQSKDFQKADTEGKYPARKKPEPTKAT